MGSNRRGDGTMPCSNPVIRDSNKDQLIAKLEEEIDSLKRKNEAQAVYLVRGFESVIRVKEEENNRLAIENAELRRSVTVLEEQLVDQAMHNVTQCFGGVNVCEVATGLHQCVNESSIDGGENGRLSISGKQVVIASPISYIQTMPQHSGEVIGANVNEVGNTEMVVVSPLMAVGGKSSDCMNSFVRNIKCKVRKNLKLP